MSTPVRMSAGALVWRPTPAGARRDLEVLLVHRPRHDDWTVPKGTVERGEPRAAAAVREVEEETGVVSRLGVPLIELEYEFAKGRRKNVAYWAARPLRGDADAYVPNREIDGVEWVPLRKAPDRVSYDTDRSVIEAFAEQLETASHKTRSLLVVRHASARARGRWRDDPLARPLTAEGKREAHRLRALLTAYGVHHVHSSGALRCVQTVAPYAELAGRPITVDHRLDEERDGGPSKKRPVVEAIGEDLAAKQPTAVCGHRTVIPRMLAAAGVDAGSIGADPLPPAHVVVVHHRRGEVHAVEQHGLR